MKVAADTAWTLLTGFLVFFMNAGFGLVEAGLCRRKNATMILSKNFVVFAIATLGFYAIGFGLMFSDGGFLGTSGGWLLSGADNSPVTGTAYRGVFGALGWAGIPLLAKFFFELVFCGTSATIVSGSVNERMKYSSFLVFSRDPDRDHLSHRRSLGLGRRLPRPRRNEGLLGIDGRSQRGRLGRARGDHHAGPARWAAIRRTAAR